MNPGGVVAETTPPPCGIPASELCDHPRMAARLTHFAINTDDVAATQAFYEDVFGWTFREGYGPPGFVQIIDDTGAPMGAIQERRQLVPDARTRGFECSFGVDDVDEVTARVIAAGGTLLMDRSAVPGVGYLIAFQDPGGNPVLAMQYDADAG